MLTPLTRYSVLTPLTMYSVLTWPGTPFSPDLVLRPHPAAQALRAHLTTFSVPTSLPRYFVLTPLTRYVVLT